MQPRWEKLFGNIGDEDQIKQFAHSINDTNPLHHDDEAAKAAGFLGIMAPGVMTLGFVSSTIAEEIPGVVVRKLALEFKNPLYPQSLPSVICTVLRQKQRVVHVGVVVKNGFEIIAEGSCCLLLPEEQQQAQAA